jgi:hypothetical protein
LQKWMKQCNLLLHFSSLVTTNKENNYWLLGCYLSSCSFLNNVLEAVPCFHHHVKAYSAPFLISGPKSSTDLAQMSRLFFLPEDRDRVWSPKRF